MTVRREVFWVEVEIIDKTMGNNTYEIPSDEQQTSDVILSPKKQKGILLITDNKFWNRLWFLFSNPFRYIFTGKVRY